MLNSELLLGLACSKKVEQFAGVRLREDSDRYARNLLEPLLVSLTSNPLKDLSKKERAELCGIRQRLLGCGTERSPKVLSKNLFRLAMDYRHHPRFRPVAEEILEVLKKSDLSHAGQAAYQLSLLKGEGGSLREYCFQALHRLNYVESYGPLAFALASTGLMGRGVGALFSLGCCGTRLSGLGLQLASGTIKLGAESFLFPVTNAVGRGLFGQPMGIHNYLGEAWHGAQMMLGLNLGARLGKFAYLGLHGVKTVGGAATRLRSLSSVTRTAFPLSTELGALTTVGSLNGEGDLVFYLAESMGTMLHLRGAQGLNASILPGVNTLMQQMDFAAYRSVRDKLSSLPGNFSRTFLGVGKNLLKASPEAWAIAVPKFAVPEGRASEILAYSQSQSVSKVTPLFRLGQGTTSNESFRDPLKPFQRLGVRMVLDEMAKHFEAEHSRYEDILYLDPYLPREEIPFWDNQVLETEYLLDFIGSIRQGVMPMRPLTVEGRRKLEFYLKDRYESIPKGSVRRSIYAGWARDLLEAFDGLPKAPRVFEANSPAGLAKWMHHGGSVRFDAVATFERAAAEIKWRYLAEVLENSNELLERFDEVERIRTIQRETSQIQDAITQDRLSSSVSQAKRYADMLFDLGIRLDQLRIDGKRGESLRSQLAGILKEVSRGEGPGQYQSFNNIAFLELLKGQLELCRKVLMPKDGQNSGNHPAFLAQGPSLDHSIYQLSHLIRLTQSPSVTFTPEHDHFHYQISVPGMEAELEIVTSELGEMRVLLSPKNREGRENFSFHEMPLILLDGIPILLRRTHGTYVNINRLKVGQRREIDFEIITHPYRPHVRDTYEVKKGKLNENKLEEKHSPHGRIPWHQHRILLPVAPPVMGGAFPTLAQERSRSGRFKPQTEGDRLLAELLRHQYSDPKAWFGSVQRWVQHQASLRPQSNLGPIVKTLEAPRKGDLTQAATMLYHWLGDNLAPTLGVDFSRSTQERIKRLERNLLLDWMSYGGASDAD